MELTAGQPQALGRSPITGLFWPLVVNRGLVLIAGEDACWHWLSTGHCFCKCIGHLVEASWDVIEFEAVKLVLQPSDFLAVRSHLGVVAARLLHDLVDD